VTPDRSSSQKTRLNDLSYGVKLWTKLSFVGDYICDKIHENPITLSGVLHLTATISVNISKNLSLYDFLPSEFSLNPLSKFHKVVGLQKHYLGKV